MNEDKWTMLANLCKQLKDEAESNRKQWVNLGDHPATAPWPSLITALSAVEYYATRVKLPPEKNEKEAKLIKILINYDKQPNPDHIEIGDLVVPQDNIHFVSRVLRADHEEFTKQFGLAPRRVLDTFKRRSCKKGCTIYDPKYDVGDVIVEGKLSPARSQIKLYKKAE
jgi:hypothetical protein